MIISISGVGGSGKTAVSKELVKLLNEKIKRRAEKFKLIPLNKLAKEKNAYIGYDKRRRSSIVGMGKLRKELVCVKKKHHNIVMEGLFAHFLKADIVIILRCNPDVLERRLRKKYKWPTKITENVEAEMISLITEETLPLHLPGTIFEVNTTKKTAKNTANTIEKIISNENERMKYVAGKIDWLESV